MTDAELRLRCLEVAATTAGRDDRRLIDLATLFYDWAKLADDAPSPSAPPTGTGGKRAERP